MASHWEDTSAAAAEEQGEKKTSSVSFGFTKTFNKFKVPAADALTSKEDKDFLSVIDKNELHSSKPTEKTKELIIPLIQKNRWHRPDRAGQSEESGVKTEETSGVKKEEASAEKDSVESLAVKELIEDSRRQLEQWENGPQTQTDPNLSIPLLMLNKVPEGFEDRDHVAGDLRPESSTEADYANIPVEAYGMALLKGMGWKKEEGIGRTFKQDVKPIEAKVRARGLGLGADRAEIKDLEPTRHKRPPKPGEEREEEQLVMGPGGCVLVVSGVHKDLYGKIEGVDPENARAVVKLAIGGKTAAISQHALKVVERKEYDKNSKDLSRLSKAHKEKEKEKEKERERREEKDKRSSGDDAKHKSAERDGGRGDRKRKHRESSPDREKSSKEARQPPAPRPWLQRDLKVRFIDKSFKGGKYYNSKMCVEDVVTPSTCVCRTEEGRLLDDVKQDMLETIVPKRDDEAIMVVLGEHRGQVGHILQRDKNKCRAIVQLDRNEQVFTLDYDSMCHYVGATDQ